MRSQPITASSQWFTGEDKVLTVTVYQGTTTTVRNISGWALSWIVKAKRTDPDASALISKDTDSGITITTPASGICEVNVTDSDISALAGEVQYWHELKRTDPGFETVLAQGPFTLSQAAHE